MRNATVRASFMALLVIGLCGCDDTKPDKPAETTRVYYKSCADAPGPIKEGDPGYRNELDRDNDGMACDESISKTTVVR